jgi:hypothetical protein
MLSHSDAQAGGNLTPLALPTPILYRGEPVITLPLMDSAHSRPKGTGRRNFNANRHHLVEGVHFFEVKQADEIRSLGLARKDGSVPAKLILLTARGYLMLARCFTDPLAWKVQDMLVETYFKVRLSAGAIPTEVLAELAALRAQLAELTVIKQQLAEIRSDLGQVIRPVRIAESVKEIHRKVIWAKSLGVCPCCTRSMVVCAANGQWAKGNHNSHHYYSVHRAALDETWPVCQTCFHQLIRSRAFVDDSWEAFKAYQKKIKRWQIERQPDWVRDQLN